MKAMKLQLAFDTFDLETALDLAQRTRDFVDIYEIGTPFALEYGMEAVRRFRRAFPDKTILADLKVMDAGKLEVSAAFRAGANDVTVLALADALTIRECVESANRFGGKIVADLICVPDIPSAVHRLEELGVHGIAVHTGVDRQRSGATPLEDLRCVKGCSRCAEISVAGGISLNTIAEYAALKPDVVIVGGAIASSADPREEARRIKAAMGRC